MLAPLAGRISSSTGSKRSDIAYLPQAADIDRAFRSVSTISVAMGLWRLTGLFGGVGRQGAPQIDHAISAVGPDRVRGAAIGTLSGGQMQRALFARLLRMRV